MESIFTRAYSYRQREHKNNLENYLIEIFAFCLQQDLHFQASFFDYIGLEGAEGLSISTQASYTKYGRPDIEIITDKAHVLIECKVDATERTNQLKDYQSILNESAAQKSKHLIYLTKFYESKNIIGNEVNYENIKWWDIYQLIEPDCNLITQQLKTFLIDKNIAMDKNFNSIDLVALEHIAGAISKMDEVLDSVKGYFTDKFDTPSKDSSRSTWLKDGGYFNYKCIGDPRKFNIDTGFMWWWEDGIIHLTVRLWIPNKNNVNEEYVNFFKQKLPKWEVEDEESVTIGNYMNINGVIATEEEQIPKMISFVKDSIDKLYELKLSNPEMFE